LGTRSEKAEIPVCKIGMMTILLLMQMQGRGREFGEYGACIRRDRDLVVERALPRELKFPKNDKSEKSPVEGDRRPSLAT